MESIRFLCRVLALLRVVPVLSAVPLLMITSSRTPSRTLTLTLLMIQGHNDLLKFSRNRDKCSNPDDIFTWSQHGNIVGWRQQKFKWFGAAYP